MARSTGKEYVRLGRLSEDRLEAFFATQLSQHQLITLSDALRVAKGLEPLLSSESSDWLTPKIIIEAAIETLGAIDLDPCSNDGKPNIPADEHYTEDDDGLERVWYGRVYMNPPYGRSIGAWVEKLCVE